MRTFHSRDANGSISQTEYMSSKPPQPQDGVDGMLGNSLSRTVLVLFASVVGLSFCLMPLELTVSFVSGVVT